MGHTMPQRRQSDPVGTLDHIRPSALKAGLVQSDASPMRSDTFGDVVKATLIAHYGSVKEAAYALGEGAGLQLLDPSLMMREFDAGKLARLEADPIAKAVVSAALFKAFAQDPKSHARRIVNQIRQLLSEFEQYVEFAS